MIDGDCCIMKKLLLLGGSAQQVPAIETAKKLGYYTVLCDYLEDNPGQYSADKFYLISTTNKEAVLEVAQNEKVDGVIAYASDPAAPTAAFVAEKMGLPSNPYQSVEILCNKDRFRSFLQENGFNAPKYGGYSEKEKAKNDIKNFSMPVIIKPSDSSGSKGVTVLYNLDLLDDAIELAFSFSRSHRIIIEEFIEKKHKYLVGGDLFIDNGKIILWGMLNCHRDNHVNNLVPIGKSYPLILDEKDIDNIKNTLQRLVDKLQIKSGGMNVELVIDKNDNVWPIDIGPRNGGNMIPDLLGMIYNIDVIEMAVKAAMGEDVSIDMKSENVFYATHNLHSDRSGLFDYIQYSNNIKPYIVKECIYKKPGEKVEFFDNASKALGIIFLKFNSVEEMIDIIDNSDKWIKVILK